MPAPSGGYLIGGSADGGAAVARLDDTGSGLWSTIFSGQKGALVECILPTADGGLAVAGTAAEGGELRSSTWVARLDADGAVLWEQTVEEGYSALIWDISDLWETDGEIGIVYEVIRPGQGRFETVVATFGPDGTPADNRTLDAFTPVLRLPDGGYVFAAFPMPFEGEGGWYCYGTVLHVVPLDASGAVIRNTSVDLGEGSQVGPLVMTDDGGYIVTVTHGPANGVSSVTGSGGAAVSIAFRRG